MSVWKWHGRPVILWTFCLLLVPLNLLAEYSCFKKEIEAAKTSQLVEDCSRCIAKVVCVAHNTCFHSFFQCSGQGTVCICMMTLQQNLHAKVSSILNIRNGSTILHPCLLFVCPYLVLGVHRKNSAVSH